MLRKIVYTLKNGLYCITYIELFKTQNHLANPKILSGQDIKTDWTI